MSQENKIENLNAVNHLNLPSLTDWEFETVKDILSNTAEQNAAIFENYVKTLNTNQQLEQYLWFTNEIKIIVDMENELSTKVARPSINHLVDQIDFNGFDYFPQIYQLTDGDVTKYEQVIHTKYITCYMYLLYKSKTSDLEYLVMKESERKAHL